MQKVSKHNFSNAKLKHKSSTLIFVISLIFFILACYMGVASLHVQWVKFQNGEDVLNEYFLTHQFIMLIVMQVMFSCLYISLRRPVFAFDSKGLYLKPGLVYSSFVYYLPWENVEHITKQDYPVNQEFNRIEILVETNLRSSTVPRFYLSSFGSLYFDGDTFSFAIKFHYPSYQEKMYREITRLQSKAVKKIKSEENNLFPKDSLSKK